MRKEENEQNVKPEIMKGIREQVNAQMATLTTKIPDYSELTPEAKEIVDAYIDSVDLSNPKTIDEFGKDETEKIYQELDMLIGTLKTNDTSISDMFTELMMSINDDDEEKNFWKLVKKSPVAALKSLKNKPKQMVEKERYRRAKVLSNIDVIRERLESIRNQLRVNAGKLEFMAQNSAKQYANTQYQMIALEEVRKKLEERRQDVTNLDERTFSQIDESLQIVGLERRITRKMENCKGIGINAATKAIMSRLVAQHNEELASDYDQDLSSLLPEMKGIVVTAEANDSLIQGANTRNQFVSGMNEMLRRESNRSREAIEKVQEISKGSAIDVETAKVLTDNVLEVVTSLRDVQDAGRPTNEAFTEILSDFRNRLTKELEINEEGEDR